MKTMLIALIFATLPFSVLAEPGVTLVTTAPVNGTTTVKPSRITVAQNTQDQSQAMEQRRAEVKKRLEEYKQMTPEQKKETRKKWNKEFNRRKAPGSNKPGSETK